MNYQTTSVQLTLKKERLTSLSASQGQGKGQQKSGLPCIIFTIANN